MSEGTLPTGSPSTTRRVRARVATSSLRFLISLPGYMVAAFVTSALWLGITIDGGASHNLAQISAIAPIFTPLSWQIIFFVCTIAMIGITTRGGDEFLISVLFFILPVTIFFALLIVAQLTRQSVMPPYFTLVVMVSCVGVLDLFVARIRAFNYLIRRVAELELEVKRRSSSGAGDNAT